MLIVKPSALGDVVQALPVAGLIKQRWPGVPLDWVVSSAFADLLDGHPFIDGVVRFDRGRSRRGRRTAWPSLVRGMWSMRGIDRRLRLGGYDLVVDLQGLLRSGWMAWRTGSRLRLGLGDAREGSGAFHTHRLPRRNPDVHAVERYLDAAQAMGCGRGPVEFGLTTRPDDEKTVDALLDGVGRPLAVLLPGTNWPTKRWPASHYAELAARLRAEGLSVVVAGAADAAPAAAQINTHVDVLDLTARTTVRQLVSLLRRADLVVSNDSGPMHIAAALGRPLVSAFGPTSPLRTGPFNASRGVVRLDVACAPCFQRHCVHQTCLAALAVDAVWHACEAVLERQFRSESAE